MRTIRAALLLLLPTAAAAQTVRGRVTDDAHNPLGGALVELRDSTGHLLQSALTSPSGVFLLAAPAPGRYRFRAAAIGYQPSAVTAITLTDRPLVLADIVLETQAMRLPELVALAGRYCGINGASNGPFGQILESAHTALRIIRSTIESRALGFDVVQVHTRTIYGGYNNFQQADTVVQALSHWPIRSIDPDTLRVVGFGRTLVPGDEATREYYGPDPEVLFADWFLERHCFSVERTRRNRPLDTLRVRFSPARGSKLVDISGELLLDAHDLSLLAFTFSLEHLPGWMPDHAAGGEMEFARLDNGSWMARTWSIWAPVAGIGGYRSISVAGQLETRGWVLRVVRTPADSVNPP